MVWRQVDKRRNIASERVGDINLVARKLKHIDAACWQGCLRQYGQPDIAAHAHRQGRAFQQMMHQGGGGGLAIGARDANHAVRRQIGPRHCEQFDVTNQWQALGLCLFGDRMAVDRNAGRHHNSLIARQIGKQRIGYGCNIGNFCARAFVIVPRQYLRATRNQRVRRGKTGARKSQDCELPVFKGGGTDHLSLRVDSPASARTKATIQKRMTTVGSDQPSCSK